jgi:hypothetical protein
MKSPIMASNWITNLKLGSFIFIQLFIAQAFAQNCTPVNTKNDDILIKASKPIQVSFHNTSMHPIYINRINGSTWSSRLDPSHWSLLAIHEKRIHLTCVESVPGHEQMVPCHQVIDLCQYAQALAPTQETQWLMENGQHLPEIHINKM